MRLTVKGIARVCHEVNRAYCHALGDLSQTVWEEAPDWQKLSAMTGVNKIVQGIIKKPSQSHESWLKQKYEEGWLYGDVKDVDKKRHPCMMPFEQLPKEQQAKDTLFFNTVKTLEPFLTEDEEEDDNN